VCFEVVFSPPDDILSALRIHGEGGLAWGRHLSDVSFPSVSGARIAIGGVIDPMGPSRRPCFMGLGNPQYEVAFSDQVDEVELKTIGGFRDLHRGIVLNRIISIAMLPIYSVPDACGLWRPGLLNYRDGVHSGGLGDP
jgi:hypothetical protein